MLGKLKNIKNNLIDNLNENIAALENIVFEQQKEIERLKSGGLINADELFTKFAGHSDYHGDTIHCIIQCMAEGKTVDVAEPLDTSKIKSEAIKEFVKKFEKKIKDVKFTLGQTWEIQNALKDTLKEMVGDDNV